MVQAVYPVELWLRVCPPHVCHRRLTKSAFALTMWAQELWCCMNAAVVHTIGMPPRCEEFSEPTALDHEVIVHVHAASLKPVDKQLASGSHYASPRDVPFVCGTDGVGHL